MICLQLANTYDPQKKYNTSSWFATPKLDGIRAVYIPQQGFFSRKGNPLSGFGALAEELEILCAQRGLSFVDGEFIIPRRTFQAIQSVVLSERHADKRKVEYHVFAAGGDFRDTTAMLKALPEIPWLKIYRVPSERVRNARRAVTEACAKFSRAGYEGVMLRHPLTAYSFGRGNNLLKLKFFREADLRIVDAWEGEGRYEDMIGSVRVEGMVGDRPVRACVGSGFSIEDRYVLFEDEHLIGKTLTVKFQSVTDKADADGFFSIRFPSSGGVKEDR